MNQKEYIELGLNGESPLKVILCGSIQSVESKKIGVVSVVFVTLDKELAKKKIEELQKNSSDYYMVYSVPYDTDLSSLEHYPSIAIMPEDLN